MQDIDCCAIRFLLINRKLVHIYYDCNLSCEIPLYTYIYYHILFLCYIDFVIGIV